MTRVISVRKQRPESLNSDPAFLYVGRQVRHAGWQGSRWANPWRVDRFASADACVRHYKAMVERVLAGQTTMASDALVERAYDWEMFVHGIQTVHLLKGRTLGCWCGTWEPGQPDVCCHAVVLAKLAEQADG